MPFPGFGSAVLVYSQRIHLSLLTDYFCMHVLLTALFQRDELPHWCYIYLQPCFQHWWHLFKKAQVPAFIKVLYLSHSPSFVILGLHLSDISIILDVDVKMLPRWFFFWSHWSFICGMFYMRLLITIWDDYWPSSLNLFPFLNPSLALFFIVISCDEPAYLDNVPPHFFPPSSPTKLHPPTFPLHLVFCTCLLRFNYQWQIGIMIDIFCWGWTQWSNSLNLLKEHLIWKSAQASDHDQQMSFRNYHTFSHFGDYVRSQCPREDLSDSHSHYAWGSGRMLSPSRPIQIFYGDKRLYPHN